MNDNKELLEILYHLIEGQKTLAETIYKMGDFDMDSRVTRSAKRGFRKWKDEFSKIEKWYDKMKADMYR